MSIDWASVNWGYVALLSGFTFIAALVVLFAAIFVLPTYYPHGIALPTLK